jgi:hypothetical protein
MSKPKNCGKELARVFLDVFSLPKNESGVHFPEKNLDLLLENLFFLLSNTVQPLLCPFTFPFPLFYLDRRALVSRDWQGFGSPSQVLGIPGLGWGQGTFSQPGQNPYPKHGYGWVF